MAASTLLHVDIDTLLAAWLKRELSGLPWLRHAGHIGSGGGAIAYCSKTPPDIVLVDWLLPDNDGFSVANELSRLSSPPKILVFTAHADDSALYLMSRAAIHGIVWKTSGAMMELRTAIAAVLAGRPYFSLDTRLAISRLRSKPDAFFKILSDREIELLRLFARGHSDTGVAAKAGISILTARSHRQHIMGKIGVHSTPALMRWAAEKGFVHELRQGPPCELIGA
jgi:DNA-binding NarL/FixJ family response regulator